MFESRLYAILIERNFKVRENQVFARISEIKMAFMHKLA
jgi:hypothetical protein